jgi:hypothetical protein
VTLYVFDSSGIQASLEHLNKRQEPAELVCKESRRRGVRHRNSATKTLLASSYLDYGTEESSEEVDAYRDKYCSSSTWTWALKLNLESQGYRGKKVYILHSHHHFDEAATYLRHIPRKV